MTEHIKTKRWYINEPRGLVDKKMSIVSKHDARDLGMDFIQYKITKFETKTWDYHRETNLNDVMEFMDAHSGKENTRLGECMILRASMPEPDLLRIGDYIFRSASGRIFQIVKEDDVVE